MATYDRQQLRAKVLARLGVLDPSQATSAEDAATIDQAIQTTLEDLYEEGLIPFDLDTTTIPAPYFDPLSFVVALPLVADFGVLGRLEMLMDQNERAMRRLRRLKAAPYVGGVVKSEYF